MIDGDSLQLYAEEGQVTELVSELSSTTGTGSAPQLPV